MANTDATTIGIVEVEIDGLLEKKTKSLNNSVLKHNSLFTDVTCPLPPEFSFSVIVAYAIEPVTLVTYQCVNNSYQFVSEEQTHTYYCVDSVWTETFVDCERKTNSAILFKLFFYSLMLSWFPALQCSVPRLAHAHLDKEVVYWGEVLTIRCRTGYEFITDATRVRTVRCNEDGSWEAPVEGCTGSCVASKHNPVNQLCLTFRFVAGFCTLHGVTYNVGHVISRTCPTGSSSSSGLAEVEARCVHHDTWHGELECQGYCGPPPLFSRASLVSFESSALYASAFFQCNAGNKRILLPTAISASSNGNDRKSWFQSDSHQVGRSSTVHPSQISPVTSLVGASWASVFVSL